MSPAKIAPVRSSIAKILKREVGGFLREFDRELHKPPASPAPPKPVKAEDPPAPSAGEAGGAAPSEPVKT